MEKVRSLAEFLGTEQPAQGAGQPPAWLAQPATIKDFAKGVLESPEYRLSLYQRIILGELPPQIETLLYHYAEGKPVDRLEVKDTTDDVDEMSVEQCEAEAMRLLEIARHLRAEGHADDASIH